MKFEVDEEAIQLIRSVLPILKTIYEAHFPWEIASQGHHEIITNKSQSKLMQFIRDFDLCPSLVSKATAYKLWQEMVTV